MSPQRPERRGSYAKGLAKREEILSSALEVIAREGYGGASVKAIADAVGLSQAGLLHYFDSKEELFTEILRKRDEADALSWRPASGPAPLDEMRDEFLALVRHNRDVPGLVQLFSRLAVDATDAGHPAHGFFLQRSAALREVLGDAVRAGQADGRVSDLIDAETLARMVQALADGMQLQWLVDRDVDMSVPIEALFTLLSPPDGIDGDIDDGGRGQRSGASDA